MVGESNLKTLLENMRPSIQKEPFAFLTSDKDFPGEIQKEAIMVFRETEGMTVILNERVANKFNFSARDRWAMITLTIHSDLNAVGFLAAITKKLAEAQISVNAVSAYFHDHLFVLWDKRDETMKILLSFGK